MDDFLNIIKFTPKLKIDFLIFCNLLMEITIKSQIKSNLNKIPKNILENKLLNLVIKELPENYNFEIQKCIWRIEEEK